MIVVVSFLVVSFAVWGIGDMFRGFGLSKVASVGSADISIEQFQRVFTERLQQLGRQLGRPVSTDQARALGLDRQVLGQMMAEAALDERTRQLGLGVTDARIAEQITGDPNFRGPTGQFDRTQFEYAIRNAGFTEGRFVQEQRRVTLRRQLANTVTGELVVPKTLADALNRFQNEQRAIEYVVLDRAQAGETVNPTPEVLAKYFEEHKVAFRAPEYRKVTVLTLSPEEIGKWMQIPEADLRRYYEQHRARFVTPERRHVRQIVFPNEDEARAAAERIAKGTPFATIATERKLSEKDIDLGTVTKSGIIDRAVADAAFALKANEVSAPVKGRFGTALVEVLAIEPEKARPLDEVTPDIRKEIATERGRNQLSDLRDKIEDERAAGSTLTEIANKLKLQARSLEIDRSGRAPDGTQPQLPASQELVPGVFSTRVGVESDPLQFGDGGLIYYDVTGVVRSRERPLEEVKQQVEERWRNEQIGAVLKANAAAMVDKLKAGTSLQQLASANGLTVATATGLTRIRPTQDIPASVLQTVFVTDKGAAASAEGQAPQRFVLRVTDITVQPLDTTSPEAKRINEALSRSIADAMLGEYLQRLEADIGTSINTTALNQAIGGGAPQ